MPASADLLQRAWAARQRLPREIIFAAPGVKHYDNEYFANRRYSFANLSVTGTACHCRCAHCQGGLLADMIATPTPQDMHRVVDRLAGLGCRGILVSGGADARGAVPLQPFLREISYAKEKGLQVLVHSGLLNRVTAVGLRQAGVDQVLLDVIGDVETIRAVYHLDRRPEDYLRAMLTCREVGLPLAPHIVIGLHYGRIHGEWRALEMIAQCFPQAVVMVILVPRAGTEMAAVTPPSLEEVAKVMATTRLLNPAIPLNLGCARPPGRYKEEVERLAVDCGVNAIAYPAEATVDYARRRGLQPRFVETCCSLAGLAAENPAVRAEKTVTSRAGQ